MNLDKRLTELEQRMGAVEGKHIWVIVPLGCNPDKIRPERAIYYPVTGYPTSNGKQRWDLREGETREQLFARATAEVEAGPGNVDILIEQLDGMQLKRQVAEP